jgi:hypothetical protein
MAHEHVMVEAGVKVMCQHDILFKWMWSITREDFRDLTIDSLSPIEFLIRKSGKVGLSCLYTNHGVLHFGQITVDKFNMLQATMAGA